LENIKKNIFLVKDPEDKVAEEVLVDRFYWTLVKKHCQ
jgi:hypothetical protein